MVWTKVVSVFESLLMGFVSQFDFILLKSEVSSRGSLLRGHSMIFSYHFQFWPSRIDVYNC